MTDDQIRFWLAVWFGGLLIAGLILLVRSLRRLWAKEETETHCPFCLSHCDQFSERVSTGARWYQCLHCGHEWEIRK